MPIYCQICRACGNKVEISRPMAQSAVREVCKRCGNTMSRDMQAEQGNFTGSKSNWPMQ
jgi:putative FmdB family regulatory protein